MKRKKEAGYGVRLGESYGIQLGQKKISKNSDFWQTLFISMLLLTIMLGANTGALGFVLGGKLKLEIVFAPVVFFLLIYGVLIWKFHFGKWLAGVFLISCALWATFRWQECRAAIDWLLNRFTVLSNQYYNVEQGMITLPEGYSEEYLKNMTGFLWNLALGWAVLEMNRNRMHFWGPAVAVSFTPVILLMFGEIPEGMTLVLYFLFYLLLIICHNTSLLTDVVSKKVQLQASLVIGGILFVLMTAGLFLERFYKPIPEVNTLKKEWNDKFDELYASRFWENFSFDLFSFTNSNKLSYSKMGQEDEVKQTKNTVVKVSLKNVNEEAYYQKPLYLKGFVGVTYKDNTWYAATDEMEEQLDEKLAGKSPLTWEYDKLENYSPEGGSSYKYYADVNVTTVNRKDPRVYAPYYMGEIDGNGDTVFNSAADGNVLNGKMQGMLYLYEPLMLGYTPEGKEEDYSAYVREHYLQLPDEKEMPEFYEKIDSTFVMDYSIGSGYVDLDDYTSSLFVPKTVDDDNSSFVQQSEDEYLDQVIQNLERMLSAYTYTKKPGRVPAGEDFVEYFLFHSRKGYCTYYASAATLILRWMGIPARYVEGYTVQAGDWGKYDYNAYSVEADVPGTRGHAWTEVYIDGFGWMPIEVTVGQLEEETTTQATTKHTADETTTQKMTTKEATSQNQQSTEVKKITPGAESNQSYVILLAALVALLIPAVLYLAIVKRRSRMLRQKKGYQSIEKVKKRLFWVLERKGCKVLWNLGKEQNVQRILKHMSLKPAEAMQMLMLLEKMYFSQTESLGKEDREALCTLAETIFYKAADSSFFIRMVLKWVWCMI